MTETIDGSGDLDITILGPVEVTIGGRLVELGSRKQRTVLAVLATEANRVVSIDRLVDKLWGDRPPAAAVGTLQAYVSNLRRLLEPDRSPREPWRVIVTQSPGYMLRISPEALDAARFEAAATAGRRLLKAGRLTEAKHQLEAALGEWQGPALYEFSFEPFAESVSARLEELRLVAVEDHLEVEIALGGHSAAVAELEALVHAHPLRERMTELLMVALYRSGRQANALQAYQAARHSLVEELGIEPGPALRRLESEILAQSTSLDALPAQTAPTPTAWGSLLTSLDGTTPGQGSHVDAVNLCELVAGLAQVVAQLQSASRPGPSRCRRPSLARRPGARDVDRRIPPSGPNAVAISS